MTDWKKYAKSSRAVRFLDLCAGIGGFSLGLEMAGMKCVGQVEIDEWCNKILAKHWPDVPRWGDIRSLDPAGLPPAELVCGGYPCQPFSSAGKRRGVEDERHLWPFILPIIAARRPAWCLFENVVGHVTLGLDCVLSDLEGLGYSVWPLVIPACGAGAPHRRYRVWIIAHAECERLQRGHNGCLQEEALNVSEVLPPCTGWISERFHLPESRICRGNDGVPRWVDRLGGLGNAVVPRLVCEIGRAIVAADDGEEKRLFAILRG